MLGLPGNIQEVIERLTVVLVIIMVGINTLRILGLIEDEDRESREGKIWWRRTPNSSRSNPIFGFAPDIKCAGDLSDRRRGFHGS